MSSRREVVYKEIVGTAFGFYSKEEIGKLGVIKLSEARPFDLLGNPTIGGIYDPRLGPLDPNSNCETCGLGYVDCPGHLAYIDLFSPVYHPSLFLTLLKLLKTTCFSCHKFLFSNETKLFFMRKFRAIDEGRFDQLRDIEFQEDFFKDSVKKKRRRSKKDAQEAEMAHFQPQSAYESESGSGSGSESGPGSDGLSGGEYCDDSKAVLYRGISSRSAKVRRKLLVEFFRTYSSIGKSCLNCGSPKPEFRHEMGKIFLKPLTKQKLREMKNKGLHWTNVLDRPISEDLLLCVPRTISKEKKGGKGQGKGEKSQNKDENAPTPDMLDGILEELESEEDGVEKGASEQFEQSLRGKKNRTLHHEKEKMRYLFPLEVQRHIQLLWEKEGDALEHIFGALLESETSTNQNVMDSENPLTLPSSSFLRRHFSTLQRRRTDPNVFFIERLMIPPSRFRPQNKLGESTFQHPQNVYHNRILQLNNQLDELTSKLDELYERPAQDQSEATAEETKLIQELLELSLQLQYNVFFFLHNPRDTSSLPKGVTQLLEKKEGLVRRHMMGKRVNCAARSVISPDPYMPSDCIGIPRSLATGLIYCEPVTSINTEIMREAVINGPKGWPLGATAIEDERGRKIGLSRLSKQERIARANRLGVITEKDVNAAPHSLKKVYRHLKDGDYLLANRQPTLHRPSIQAFKAKIIDSSDHTLRLHYANCSAFNADFDGDEMNVHFPQNQLARAEALSLCMAGKHYIVPKNGAPIRGLIQDNVVAGVLLTKRDTFLDQETFQSLFYEAVMETNSSHNRVLPTPVPAILKPKPLWTGKQLIGAVISQLASEYHPLNLDAQSKIPSASWGSNCEESTVVFRDNELLCGVLDKAHFGSTPFGLVHACYELMGDAVSEQVLSCLGRLFTVYLQRIGFTCGIDDLLLDKEANSARDNLLASSPSDVGHDVASEFTEKPAADSHGISSAMSSLLFDSTEVTALDSAMKKQLSSLTSTIIQGAIPSGQAKKFPHNNLALMTVAGAKGSVVNHSQISCLLGQQELEGKRVPRMGSGKTLPCFEPFDVHPRAGGYVVNRFLTGIQLPEYFFHCMAGREGLVDTAVKTSRSGYLQRCLVKHLEGAHVAYDSTVRETDGSLIQFFYGEDGLDNSKTKFLEKLDFYVANFEAVSHRNAPKANLQEELGIPERAVRPQNFSAVDKYLKKHKNADPVMSRFDPNYYIGSVSEKFRKNLNEYIRANKSFLKSQKVKRKKFRAIMLMKFYNSLLHPGESVGTLAAQCIGEPSTQMTLNTFHLAGTGATNVTLGIPRLREIIMSGTITTPTMTIYLHPSEGENDQSSWGIASTVARRLRPARLRNIVKDIEIVSQLIILEHIPIFEVSILISLKSHPEFILSDFDLKKALYLQFLPALFKQLKMKPPRSAKDSIQANQFSGYMGNEDEGDDNARSPNDVPIPSHQFLRHCSFDEKKRSFHIVLQLPPSYQDLEISRVVQDTTQTFEIPSIPGIKNCFVLEGKGTHFLQTEGVNLEALSQFSEIDHRRIKSNSISMMQQMYGIEACYSSIMSEIANVFGVYGISVDPRHLSLVADYMTFNGDYRVFNRLGMEANPSPLQRMTFETTVQFLTRSALFGDCDDLRSPSARLVLGQPISVGTGICECLPPLQYSLEERH